MKTPIYDKMWFISKFSRLPSRRLIPNSFEDGDAGCVMGHCGVRHDNAWSNPPEEAVCLAKLFGPGPEGASIFSSMGYGRIVGINNQPTKKYPQRTPKARVLAALHDLP